MKEYVVELRIRVWAEDEEEARRKAKDCLALKEVRLVEEVEVWVA